MKKTNKKLSFERETLVTLTAPDLGDINGGTHPTVVILSARFCRYAGNVVKGAVAVGRAVSDRWTQPTAGTCTAATGS